MYIITNYTGCFSKTDTEQNHEKVMTRDENNSSTATLSNASLSKYLILKFLGFWRSEKLGLQ